jgi:hypothetical protein
MWSGSVLGLDSLQEVTMADIESSGSVDFTKADTPTSGVLYDAAAEKAAIQEARSQSIMYDRLSSTWAEAVAKDQRVQNHHHNQQPRTSRGMSYRTRQDWRRTVHGIQRQTHNWFTPSPSSSPYGKGADAGEGVDVIRSILRWLGWA